MSTSNEDEFARRSVEFDREVRGFPEIVLSLRPSWIGETDEQEPVDGRCPHDDAALATDTGPSLLQYCPRCARVWMKTGARLLTCWRSAG